MKVKTTTLEALLVAAGKILDSQRVPVRNRKAWINVNGKVVMVDAGKVQRERKGRKKEGPLIGRIDIFSTYKERSPMNISKLIDQITKDLPGSIGAAQVGQVVKATLDSLAVNDTADTMKMLDRRRKGLIRQAAKKLSKAAGSANCVLPRARKVK